MTRKAAVAALLFFATLLVLGSLARRHPYGTYETETDFYQLYAPDAERIAAGALPLNTYQGPGYALVLALAGPDSFAAGKVISVVSGAAVVWLTFLLFEGLFGRWVGAGAAVLVAVSPRFAEHAISATTDVFYLMLSLLALVLLTRERVALGGVVVGLAYLTRYNGVSLVLAALVVFALARQWKRAALFLGAFIVTVSPWLYLNARQHGSPLYNTNYLNIATRFHPELAGGRTDHDGTRQLADVFHSLGEVLRHDPVKIVRAYPMFVAESVRNTVVKSLVGPGVAWLGLLGIVLTLRRHPLLPITGALHLLVVSLTHWETRYYFVIMVLYAGLAVYSVVWLFERARERGMFRRRGFVGLPMAAVALLSIASAAPASAYVRRLLVSHPVEVAAACPVFDGQRARVVARKPHLGRICGQEWVFFPPVRTFGELHAWLEANRVDYVAYGLPEAETRPALVALADPRRAPPWLQPVWMSTRPLLVLYRPIVAPSGRDR